MKIIMKGILEKRIESQLICCGYFELENESYDYRGGRHIEVYSNGIYSLHIDWSNLCVVDIKSVANKWSLNKIDCKKVMSELIGINDLQLNLFDYRYTKSQYLKYEG